MSVAVADKVKEWYTVKGAAEYLGVSEPTVFRWMKIGTLSFFKVGGATRFSEEGLKAVIEKRTGTAEAEAAAGRCASCGHAELIGGRLRGAGLVYFQPDTTRFWVLDDSFIGTEARMCPACGYIQVHGEVGKLARLVGADRNE